MNYFLIFIQILLDRLICFIFCFCIVNVRENKVIFFVPYELKLASVDNAENLFISRCTTKSIPSVGTANHVCSLILQSNAWHSPTYNFFDWSTPF